jgi:hypothetical protein
MRWKTKLLVPISGSLAYLVASFFANIVPCQIGPNVPNPVYSWGFCNLNPDQISPFGVQSIYWGISPQLTNAYLISIVAIFLVIFGIIMILPRSSHHGKKEEKDNGKSKN